MILLTVLSMHVMFACPVYSSDPETLYFRNLGKKENATIADAIHIVARFNGYKGATNTYSELNYLYSKNIVFRDDIMDFEDVHLTRGNAANIILKALKHKGWVMYRLFPSSQRYALREAKRLKLFPRNAVVYDAMSGRALLGILSKMAELKKKQNQGYM